MNDDWREDALCKETDPEAFFPGKGESPRSAKRTCMSCAARADCLEFALTTGQRFGIWGGHTERERRKLRKKRELVEVEDPAATEVKGAAA